GRAREGLALRVLVSHDSAVGRLMRHVVHARPDVDDRLEGGMNRHVLILWPDGRRRTGTGWRRSRKELKGRHCFSIAIPLTTSVLWDQSVTFERGKEWPMRMLLLA